MKTPGALRLRALMLIATILAMPSLSFAQQRLDDAITEIATQITEQIRDSDMKTVAVLDFAMLDGSVNALGQHLAESLITELLTVAPERYEIIERRRLSVILREQKLSVQEIFEEDSLAEVGKLLGVKEVVTGTVSELDTQITVNARLINVETARVTSAFSISVAREGPVDFLLGIEGPGRSSARPGAKAGEAEARFVVDDVVVEVVRAKRKGTSVEVEVALTSTRRDVDVALWGRHYAGSRAITSNGNTFGSRYVTLGTAEDDGSVVATLVTGIRTKGVFRFDGVESDAEFFARLDLRGRKSIAGANKWSEWSIIPRNITISR